MTRREPDPACAGRTKRLVIGLIAVAVAVAATSSLRSATASGGGPGAAGGVPGAATPHTVARRAGVTLVARRTATRPAAALRTTAPGCRSDTPARSTARPGDGPRGEGTLNQIDDLACAPAGFAHALERLERAHGTAAFPETVAAVLAGLIRELAEAEGSADAAQAALRAPGLATDVRRVLLDALVASGSPAAERGLREMAAGRDPLPAEARREVVLALGGLTAPAGATERELERLARAADPEIAGASLQALGSLAGAELDGPGRERRAEVLEAVGSARPDLEAAFLRALGSVGAPRARTAVLRAIARGDEAARAAAVAALGAWQDAEANAALAAAVTCDPCAGVRAAAARMASWRGDPGTAAALLEAAHGDGDPAVRQEAARALAERARRAPAVRPVAAVPVAEATEATDDPAQ